MEDTGAAIFSLFPPSLQLCQISLDLGAESMAPPLEAWPAYQLPERARVNVKDRKRKGFNGDLKACELLELLQYNCDVEKPVTKDSLVRCWPVVRLFRR